MSKDGTVKGSSVREAIEHAYECDREGRESEAVKHYDRAWALGVPQEERRTFLIGYGSTLRNVGRVEESVSVLRAAVKAHPNYPALRAFLALSLHSLSKSESPGTEANAERNREAVAQALRAIAETEEFGLDGYARALREYASELASE